MMAKVIRMPHLVQAEHEKWANVFHLKALVDKYITTNKRATIEKIKSEQ